MKMFLQAIGRGMLLIGGAAWAAEFRDDFSRAAGWRLSAGGPAKAVIQAGRLTLDMRAAQAGKWAFATCERAVQPPARIVWRQRLTHDSPHAYFAGVLLTPRGAPGRKITAGLAGGGVGRCAFLGRSRSPARRIRVGAWYRLELEISPLRQTLRVFEENSPAPAAALAAWRVLDRRPLNLRFFLCDYRLGPGRPDTYAQDRGAAEFDDLCIAASGLPAWTPPKPPTVTNPFAIPLVFNRAMRWVEPRRGSLGPIMYDAAGRLALTGERAASRWLELKAWVGLRSGQWPDQPNIAAQGEATTFRLPAGAKAARFMLRAFQFNVEQHGRLVVEALPQAARWRLRAFATDGVRLFAWPLWDSGWSDAFADKEIDFRAALRRAGRPNRYPEVDFTLELERTAPVEASVRLRLGFEAAAAIVPRQPAVVPAEDARAQGVAVDAVLVNARGELVRDVSVAAAVEIAGRREPLRTLDSSGVRRAVFRGLPAGDYRARLTALDPAGRPFAETELEVCVTSLPFLSHYEPDKRSYCTPQGEAAGPLLGDLFAWVPYADAPPMPHRLALGLRAGQAAKKLFLTKWRSLPRRDIDAYVNYMADSGVRALRLTPNVSPAEYYLDAGGRLAPHGLEQLSYILAAARRRGLRVLINLFHYPYYTASTGRKPPVMRYIEAGYPARMSWRSAAMWRYLSAYLDQLLAFTGRDPAVLGYTVMGENDQFLPPAWLNRAAAFVHARAPRQMTALEQGGCFRTDKSGRWLTWRNYAPARSAGLGFRTYSTLRHPSDCFIALAVRRFNLVRPSYTGEVACGVRTAPGFVVKYRDAMGLALTLQQPLCLAWSAALLEGQCRAFTAAARRVDWTAFRRARPAAAVVVDDRLGPNEIQRLALIEEALASAALDYEYVTEPFERGRYAWVIDSRRPPARLDAPPAARAQAPLRVSPGNHTTYALSQDRRWLLAYVRNARHYELGECDIRSVERYRLADRPRALVIELRGFPGRRRCTVWDAATAGVLRESIFERGARLDLGVTAADALVLVEPEGGR